MPMRAYPLQNIRKVVRRKLSSSRGSHDWEHTRRVYNLCLKIGKPAGADLGVLRLAALLHDIGREHQDRSGGVICHAVKGAALASLILKRHGVDRPTREKVLHCIESHRFRGKKAPVSLEREVDGEF